MHLHTKHVGWELELWIRLQSSFWIFSFLNDAELGTVSSAGKRYVCGSGAPNWVPYFFRRREMSPSIFIDGEHGTTGLQIRTRLEQRKDINLMSLAAENRRSQTSIRKGWKSNKWLSIWFGETKLLVRRNIGFNWKDIKFKFFWLVYWSWK